MLPDPALDNRVLLLALDTPLPVDTPDPVFGRGGLSSFKPEAVTPVTAILAGRGLRCAGRVRR